MTKPTRIIIDIRGGILYSVYGDKLPEGVEIDVILRDQDNIEAGDADPLPEDYQPELHYW